MSLSSKNPIVDLVLREIHAKRLIELASAICDVHSPTGQEGEVARLLQSLMEKIGMRTVLQEVEEGRPNVIGVLEGQGGGRTLLFNGHMDTSFPFMLGGSGRSGLLERPLPSRVDGGWLYGTGIDNMKSAFACYLGAVEALQRADIPLAGDIVISGVVGEIETSPVGQYDGPRYRGFGHGTRYFIAHGALADFCIIGEPSNLSVEVGSCGTVWVRITTHGPVMGSYRSDWETSAINRAVRVIEGLQSWKASYIARHRHHSVEPTVTISSIEGGWPWRASRSPADCSIYVDVRIAPDQPLISIRNDLLGLVRSFDPEDKRYRSEVDFYATIPGSEISTEAEIVRAVQHAHAAVTGQESPYRYSQAVNDAAHFNRYGIPSVIYGPGGARREDGTELMNEYVRIDNMVDCTKVYALTALEVCNSPARSQT